MILVQAASPLPDARIEELQAFCTSAIEKDEVNSYSFQSTPFSTAYDHATPPIWGKTRKDDASYNQAVMGWDSHLLSDYRMDAAYADNNALLLGDAVAAAKKQVANFFPNDALDLTNVAVFDRTFYKKTGETISEKGYYHLEFHQIFHSIPFIILFCSNRLLIGNLHFLNCTLLHFYTKRLQQVHHSNNTII